MILSFTANLLIYFFNKFAFSSLIKKGSFLKLSSAYFNTNPLYFTASRTKDLS